MVGLHQLWQRDLLRSFSSERKEADGCRIQDMALLRSFSSEGSIHVASDGCSIQGMALLSQGSPAENTTNDGRI